MSDLPSSEPILPRKFLRMCRRRMRHAKVADSSGAELTGAGLLMRTLILRRILRARCSAADEQHVGLLLPPSVAGAGGQRRPGHRLPRRRQSELHDDSPSLSNDCIAQCGIRHVLTSRRLMERFNLKLNAELVYLEDFKDEVTRADKLDRRGGSVADAACAGWSGGSD